MLDHFRDEVHQDWDATLATFPHPHYELIAPMTVHDGDDAVRGYYADTRVAFPDQDHELIALRHSVDAVIVEFWPRDPPRPARLDPTHRGTPPHPDDGLLRLRRAGEPHRGADLLHQLTVLRQLIAGLNLRSPRGLLTLGRVLLGARRMSGAAPDPRLLRTAPPRLDD